MGPVCKNFCKLQKELVLWTLFKFLIGYTWTDSQIT
jgi:hypothetical protein